MSNYEFSLDITVNDVTHENVEIIKESIGLLVSNKLDIDHENQIISGYQVSFNDSVIS